MKLLEHAGKQLLKKQGIAVPESRITTSSNKLDDPFYNEDDFIVKAHILSGKRMKRGLILKASKDNVKDAISQILAKDDEGQPIKEVLVEEKQDVEGEYFLSILYDTNTRKPMIIFSAEGGVDIESNKTERIASIAINPIEEVRDSDIIALLADAEVENEALVSFIKNAFNCFWENDCRNLEINPILKTPNGLVAGDCKIILDESAIKRHEDFANLSQKEEIATDIEKEARAIDKESYRGVAGKTFLELDGDIAVLASGGGASLTAMDALVEAGGKPANYTEYSGNPPKEKVKRLTEVTLSKKGLKGCIVVGGTANFTDIYETLSGFIEGVLNTQPKPTYPIVIRRAGPRDKEAFDMIKEIAEKENLNITLLGEEVPISKAAVIMVEKAYNRGDA